MKKMTLLPLTIFLLISMSIFLNPAILHSKRKAAIVETPSVAISNANRLKVDGLEYEVLSQAAPDAKTPIKSQSVSVHYTGWLKNSDGSTGKKFDSSVDRNQPFNFVLGVGQVIAGWDKMVALMKVGQKVRVYIPAVLAYGARGHGAIIPKSADLIFDIELLKIN